MIKTLVHELRAGDSLLIDDRRVTVTLLSKSGQRARLSVSADDSIKIEKGQMPTDAEQARNGLRIAAMR